MTRWNWRRSLTESILGGNRLGCAGWLGCADGRGFAGRSVVAEELGGFKGFMMDFVKGRDTVVPLEEGGGTAAELDGVGVKLPDRIEHGMIVGIEDILFEFGMSCDVNLADAMVRDVVQIVEGIEAVVFGRYIDVINIEKDAAVGHLDDFAEKLPLGHFGLVKLGVTADVLDTDGDFDKVANLPNLGGGMFGDG
jgi:hypothetical protein